MVDTKKSVIDRRIMPLKYRIQSTFSSIRFLLLSAFSVLSRLIPSTLFVNYVFWDGYLSWEFYKHQKMFPDQILRFSRIAVAIAWFGGASSLLAGVYFIGDGVYSVIRYRFITKETKGIMEDLPRIGRALAGVALILVPGLFLFHL
jgi:hypothetical protein